ncbi:hypothetical protein [Bradyrhizobium sp. AZCC 1719]|uniref:hypothetical protein n=1 Tax=Bradyrhizobium sp. AZCC 1719 TaxID=3117028 RepID=UPI002FF327FC
MLLIIGMVGPVSAAETYVCIGEQSTGFKWNGSAWERAGFHADKFVISQGETKSDYVVKQPGSNRIAHRCERAAIGAMAAPQMACGGLAYNFIFNFETLRFQEFHGLGYVEGDSPGNTPYIMIGKCTKL